MSWNAPTVKCMEVLPSKPWSLFTRPYDALVSFVSYLIGICWFHYVLNCGVSSSYGDGRVLQPRAGSSCLCRLGDGPDGGPSVMF